MFTHAISPLSILVAIQIGSTKYDKFNEGLTLLECSLGDMGDIFQVEGFHREHEVDMWLIHQQDQVESFRVDASKLAGVRASCPRSAWAGS